MTARPKLAPDDQMTIEEFLAFTQTRPDEEHWELIEGVPVLNASPVDYHQVIVMNLTFMILTHKQRTGASWLPMPGTGTRVPISPQSLPQPDVLVIEGQLTGRSDTNDALVIFEVPSRSNAKTDQLWRRKVYVSVPNCQHYVTVSLKSAEATAFDRATGWKERTATGLDQSLELPALGLALPLVDVYRYTPVGT